jgi:hypothetical protein
MLSDIGATPVPPPVGTSPGDCVTTVLGRTGTELQTTRAISEGTRLVN